MLKTEQNLFPFKMFLICSSKTDTCFFYSIRLNFGATLLTETALEVQEWEYMVLFSIKTFCGPWN